MASDSIKIQQRRCSRHGYTCLVLVEDEDTSYRLTKGKCCGSWDELVKEYTLGVGAIDRLIEASTEYELEGEA